MPPGFPPLSFRKLLRIVERHADHVRTNGSHMTYRSKKTQLTFTFARRNKDYGGGLVRKILTKDLGLDLSTAREEVNK